MKNQLVVAFALVLVLSAANGAEKKRVTEETNESSKVKMTDGTSENGTAVGIHAGAGFGRFSDLGNASSRTGLAGGVGAEFALDTMFSLAPELNYVQKGGVQNST